jgi:GTP-binding protein Era
MSHKSGFVTIIGRPNVGKSTLLNKLAGEKIAIMSDKAQTTRNNIKAILSAEDYQIIFIDTPGIHKPQSKLGKFMVKSATDTLKEVDAALFVVQATDREIGAGDRYILEELKKSRIPVFLAINKIDAIKKEELFPIIERFSRLFEFKTVIPISALQGDGVDIIVKELLNVLPEGPKFYPDDMITEEHERNIMAEIIREKALNLLNEEIPHGIAVEVVTMKERPDQDLIDIKATIFCEKESHKPIIIGKNGSMLKEIGKLARFDMEKFLSKRVFLELWVKVKKDWKDSDLVLKSLFREY